MSSYPPTTPLPSYPSRVTPDTVPLPEDDSKLMRIYLYIGDYLERLWDSYLAYCRIITSPEASKVFDIIFNEMDFFEILRGRVLERMSLPFRRQVHHEYVI